MFEAERVDHAQKMVGENVGRVRAIGQSGPAVADHVVSGHAEVLGETCEITGVGLEVAAGAVEQDEVGAAPGLEHASADAVHIDVAELVVEVPEVAPDADVALDLLRRRPRREFGVRHVCSFFCCRASSTSTSPALSRRVSPRSASSREFSIVRNSTGFSFESLKWRCHVHGGV